MYAHNDAFEMAERLVEKTGCTFEDAREALRASDNDLLEAIIWLERNGKSHKAAQMGSYSTAQAKEINATEEMNRAQREFEKASRRSKISEGLDRFFKAVGDFLRSLIDVQFVVYHSDRRVMSIPLLLLIVLLILLFWIILPLLIIGLFTNFKYRFVGVDTITVDVNEIAERASRGAEQIKNDIRGDAHDTDKTDEVHNDKPGE